MEIYDFKKYRVETLETLAKQRKYIEERNGLIEDLVDKVDVLEDKEREIMLELK